MSKMSKTIAVLGVVAGLGVAALPLSTYAANPQNVTLNVQVTDKVELSADETSIPLTVVNNGPIAEGTTNITVTTSNSKGYTLNAKTNNVNLQTTDGDSIAAGVPEPNATTSAWGMKGGNQAFASYKGLTTDDQIVKSTTAAPTGGTDTVPVTFGVATASNQHAGTYTGTVTFTATAKI